MRARILVGDAIVRMRKIEADSVCSVVTDPPYGIRFMGKAWDGADIDKEFETNSPHEYKRSKTGRAAAAGSYSSTPKAMLAFQEFSRAWAVEALRVLKPGGYILCFASTRTYHRMASGVEDAGFEVRDQIGWCFGSGFPKSHNLHGAWEGWGTALKPAWEPILLARKPFKGSVAANVGLHGTGALNIFASRVGDDGGCAGAGAGAGARVYSDGLNGTFAQPVPGLGRWPANLIHDGSEEVLSAFPEAPGQCADVKFDETERKTQSVYGAMKRGHEPTADKTYADAGGTNFAMKPGARRLDEGSAARFFYCAKASQEDRDEGCSQIAALAYSHDGRDKPIDNAYQRNSSNSHPTVKPTDLMQYLCRLVTPPGGTVLDPFMGSGSTGKAALREGFDFIGIEMLTEYVAIAEARIRTSNPLFSDLEVSW